MTNISDLFGVPLYVGDNVLWSKTSDTYTKNEDIIWYRSKILSIDEEFIRIQHYKWNINQYTEAIKSGYNIDNMSNEFNTIEPYKVISCKLKNIVRESFPELFL